MTIPNILTIIRLFMMPVFLLVYFSSAENAHMWAMAVLVFSFITDVLDGFIARTFNQTSNLGKILDPIADKVMQITVLLCLALYKQSLMWVVIFVFIKDILIGIGAIYMHTRGYIAQSNWFGKIACFASVAASIILIFPFQTELGEAWVKWLSIVIVGSNAVALAAYAIYFFKNIYGKPKVKN